MRISDWSSDVCSSDLGGGSNSLALSGSSTLAGNVALGGNGSSLGLSGSAQINGDVDFGGGASTLTLSGTAALNGAIGNAGNVAVAMNGGTLNAGNKGAVALASLAVGASRSEEHTSELQSLMRISYAVFCLKKKKTHTHLIPSTQTK